MKQVIIGNLWTTELEDKAKLVFSEAGECSWERSRRDIGGEEELGEYLVKHGCNITEKILYISEHTQGHSSEDKVCAEVNEQLSYINPLFTRKFPKQSKNGLIITAACAQDLQDCDENEIADLDATIFSVKYRDSRDRNTNPFHYTGAIAGGGGGYAGGSGPRKGGRASGVVRSQFPQEALAVGRLQSAT